MKTYEKKYFNLKTLDVDKTTRSVKIAIAETETKDHDGDIIVPEAFKRTIKAKGPTGSNEIWHLLDHTPTSFSALSKFSELYQEGKYIVGVSKFKDSFAWREVAWPLYESGDFTQHSIGFRTVRQEQKSDYNEIQELELFEGSAVLWGANSNTPTLGVNKSLTFEEQQTSLHSRLERLLKFIHSSQDMEERKSLIEIEFRQIQQQLSELKNATQPVEKTPDPVKDDNELLDVIKTFNKTLKETEHGSKGFEAGVR
jgi:phage head maturation protease